MSIPHTDRSVRTRPRHVIRGWLDLEAAAALVELLPATTRVRAYREEWGRIKVDGRTYYLASDVAATAARKREKKVHTSSRSGLDMAVHTP